ncbi:MAG: hypothetical protein AB1757_03620 [Acidobacteriota bacterium]
MADWVFTGGTTTIIQGIDNSISDYEQWRQRVVQFILKIAESPDFAVKDNGYEKFPEVLVGGVACFYRGKPFAIFCDLPNELIICHNSLRLQLANDLINELKTLWLKTMY